MTDDQVIKLARKHGGVPWQFMGENTKYLLSIEDLKKLLLAEKERLALICDRIEFDRWALYKGRPPYIGNEPGRADPYIQGVSDGAGLCANALRNDEHE